MWIYTTSLHAERELKLKEYNINNINWGITYVSYSILLCEDSTYMLLFLYFALETLLCFITDFFLELQVFGANSVFKSSGGNLSDKCSGGSLLSDCGWVSALSGLFHNRLCFFPYFLTSYVACSSVNKSQCTMLNKTQYIITLYSMLWRIT